MTVGKESVLNGIWSIKLERPKPPNKPMAPPNKPILKAMEINIDRIQKGQSVDTVKLYLGKFYMDKIRRLSHKIDTDEEQLLQSRQQLQESSDKKMTYYLLGLSTVTLLFLGIFFFAPSPGEIKDFARSIWDRECC